MTIRMTADDILSACIDREGKSLGVQSKFFRSDRVAHRSNVTAVDKLATPGTQVLEDILTGGALAAATNYKVAVAAGNALGPTLPSAVANTTTAADGNPTHGIRLTSPAVSLADRYHVFCSIDAAPKYVAQISEAQRSGGCTITAMSTVVGETSDAVAEKIRAALTADPVIAGLFTVSGATDKVILTKIKHDADDGTMNIAISNGSCAGITAAPLSADTTPGVLGVCQKETATVVGDITKSGNASVVITAAGMTNSPKTIDVPVVLGTLQVETMTVVGTVTQEGACKVVVTMDGVDIALYPILALDDTADQVAGKIKTAMAANPTINAAFTLADDGDPGVLTLTAKTKKAYDHTLNVSLTNFRCAGLTESAGSTSTTAGVPQDTAALVAGKIRAALEDDADVSAFFVVSGEGAEVILTAKADAADDATMNISIDNGTCTGLTTAANSADTAAGVSGTPQVETATVVAAITKSGDVSVMVTTAAHPTPIMVSVPVLDYLATGKIDIMAVGTGIVTTNTVFAQSNAFTPASVTAIDCSGVKVAYISVELAVTDLSVAPSLNIVPFLSNSVGNGANSWYQGTLQPVQVLGGVGQPLRNVYAVDVDGANGLVILVSSIAGLGASATVWVELA